MEYIFLGIIAVFSILFLKESMSYGVASFDTSGGPGLFPKYIIILLLIAVLCYAVWKILKKDKTKFEFVSLFLKERGVILLSLVLYLALLQILGFTVSTILFLCFTTNFLYYKTNAAIGTKKGIIFRVLFSVAAAFFVRFIFVGLMHVILPKGLLF